MKMFVGGQLFSVVHLKPHILLETMFLLLFREEFPGLLKGYDGNPGLLVR